MSDVRNWLTISSNSKARVHIVNNIKICTPEDAAEGDGSNNLWLSGLCMPLSISMKYGSILLEYKSHLMMVMIVVLYLKAMTTMVAA